LLAVPRRKLRADRWHARLRPHKGRTADPKEAGLPFPAAPEVAGHEHLLTVEIAIALRSNALWCNEQRGRPFATTSGPPCENHFTCAASMPTLIFPSWTSPVRPWPPLSRKLGSARGVRSPCGPSPGAVMSRGRPS